MTTGKDLAETTTLSDEQLRRRRGRSIALGLALGGRVLIMIAITLVKGPAIVFQPV